MQTIFARRVMPTTLVAAPSAGTEARTDAGPKSRAGTGSAERHRGGLQRVRQHRFAGQPASTAAAAARPSAIAHTISDCPRPMSPATKTPGTVVMYPVPADVAPLVDLTPSCVEQARALRRR